MTTGDPLDHDAADEGEQEASFEPEQLMGAVSRSDEQNGDTR